MDEGDTDAATVAALVSRARKGDRDAFGDLYRRYHAPVTKLVRCSLRPDAVEDAVADAFLKAWRALPRYSDTGVPFVGWLCAIARNVVIDAARRRVRRPEATLADDLPVDPWPRGEEQLDLAAAVAALPDEQRQVITLKYFAGLDNHDVAVTLGKSAGAVNTQQWRALRSLRKILEKGS